ncbi:alpha/beta hydrolase [Sporolactobacillus sp. KGMB 08714]|uniref:alpha/beta hydrolase n=1 Tax=Sporolactobacillus sp. KGMB 08714 TaxID=3064704 RepID=UPI002FBE45DC
MKLQGKMSDIAVESKLLMQTLPVISYLPPDYDPDRRYPLLIAQDGRDYLQIGRLFSTADDWIGKNIIRAIIVIAIPYENLESRRQLYHPDGPKNRSYLRALSEEIVPQIAGRISIDPDPESRTLIGDSLGGTVSLAAALERPDLFRGVIMQSPYVNERIIEQIGSTEAIRALSIYHSIGREETAVKTTRGTVEDFLLPNRMLHRALSRSGPNHYTFHELDGGHTWRSWKPDVRSALLERFYADA